MKFIEFLKTYLKYAGIFVILSFSSLSIYFTSLENSKDSPTIREKVSYARILEERFYDYRYIKQLNKPKSKNIVLLKIDDLSVNKIGRFPWSRSVQAQIVNRLSEYNAKTIVYDVLFPESENHFNPKSTHPDILFSQAILNFQKISGRNVILPYKLSPIKSEETLSEIPENLFDYLLDSNVKESARLKSSFILYTGFPIKEILKHKPALAFLDSAPTMDGIFRDYFAITDVDGMYFSSLGLQAYQSFLGIRTKIESQVNGDAKLILENTQVPIHYEGQTKLRYWGGKTSFDQLSVFQLLYPKDQQQIEENKKILMDKIVFIGSTTTGAHDLRHSPIDSQIPGVYVHMNFTQMLLENYLYKDQGLSLFYSFLILVLSTVIIFLVQLYNHAITDLIGVVIIAFSIYFIDSRYFIPQGFEVRVLFCLGNLILIYSWITFLNFYKSINERRQIKNTFSRYVAPSIVEQMLNHPDELILGGTTKEITCIFSDLKDFTSISENLKPEQLSYCLNYYLDQMTEVMFESNGTLDKYIGDALVGFWGAPVPLVDHAYRGIKSALKMLNAMPAINEHFTNLGYPSYYVRIGMNSGPCSVGNMGSHRIFSYTALGDNMNLGARLESICKYYGAQFIISEQTWEKLTPEQKSEFTVRKLDHIQVKGKKTSVWIYEILHDLHPLKNDPRALKDFEESLSLYQNKKFQEAANISRQYSQDIPCQRLYKSCSNFLENGPKENWNGVTVFDEK